MALYIIKLIILIPLVGGMAYGALWLWKRVQPGMALGQREKLVRVVDAVPLGASGRLAVVEFEDRRLLLAVSRNGVQLITDNGRGQVEARS